MEFLNNKLIILIAILFNSLAMHSQTHEQISKAFHESYVNESKANYTGAIADLQKVYKADSYELNLRIGWLYYCSKKYTSSMEYYQKAIDLRKFSVEARFGYVAPADASKLYDKSYEMYVDILKIDPYNKTANYWVGINYYTVKKYEQASKYFELLVNMYPFDYDANHMLGWTYLFLGKTGEAKILFEKALLNRPEDASAKDGMSRCK